MTARLGLSPDSEKTGEIVRDAEAMYDSLTAKKMTELEAYRQVMRELDRIEEKLREERAEGTEPVPAAETEAQTETGDDTAVRREEAGASYSGRRMKRLVGKLNAIMWLATPALYVLLSSAFGGWGKWWLLFLSSTIGSIILDMLLDWNRGVPPSRMKGHFIGILWLASVIAYFLLSFAVGWKLTWIVFIVAAILSVILGENKD